MNHFTTVPRTVYQKEVLKEHEKRVYHMYRRIHEQTGLSERKKNRDNPLLYPTFLLREAPRSELKGYQSIHGFYSPPERHPGDEVSRKQGSLTHEERESALQMMASEEDYVVLQEEIWLDLVQLLLYREEDIRELLRYYEEIHTNLNSLVLRWIFGRLCSNLKIGEYRLTKGNDST